MKRFKSIVFSVALGLIGLAFAACGAQAGGNGVENVRIGATAIPHSQILSEVVPVLYDKGFNLEIIIFDDFVQPNLALAAGDIDINFFQHTPFLTNFNYNHGTELIPVFGVHFEPLRLYAGRLDNIDNVDLQGVSIGIPDDPTNEARALQLLESVGLIGLPVGGGLTVSANDVTTNPNNIDIIPMSAELLPRALEDLDFAVINGNFALLGGVIDYAIDGVGEVPGSEAAITFTNYVVVRDGDENEAAVQALIEALNSDNIRNFIYQEYQGRVVPTF